MKSLVIWIIAVFTAAANGFQYTAPPEKPFMATYYVDESAIGKAPDYRAMYKREYEFELTPKEESVKDPIPVDEKNAIVTIHRGDGNSKKFVFTIPKADQAKYDAATSTTVERKTVLLEPYDSQNNTYGYRPAHEVLPGVDGIDGMYAWKVTKGTQLISPMISTVVTTVPFVVSPYPKGSSSKGVNVSLIAKETFQDKKYEYKITYYNMERLWVDMTKTTPDGYMDNDRKYPIYKPTVTFTDEDVVHPAAVIGLAGRTGIDRANEELQKDLFVVVGFQRREVVEGNNATWEYLTPSDFYLK